MKKAHIYIFSAALALSVSSCDLFKLDNYAEPSETIFGTVTDIRTGEPVLTDQGSEGIRIRLTETSWEGNVTPQDFYCKMNGSFRNARLFEADYNIRIDGPFVPIYMENSEGTIIKDETVNFHASGEKEINFQVQPFLKVELVGSPQVSDGTVTARVKVTRATTRAELAEAMNPTGDWTESCANVTDIQLFVSRSSTVGYRARDSRWSGSISYSGTEFENLLGTPVTIKSNGTVPSGQKVFIRAAARINYDTPRGSGTRRWNYSDVVEVDVP